MNMYRGSLSNEQSRFFRDIGYLKIPNCFDATETAELRDFVEHEAATEGDINTDLNPTRKLYSLYDRNPAIMRRTVGKQALIGALVSLLGPNVVFVKNRHNHATINNKQGEPAEGMHRDILQPSRGLITAAIYLQESTVDNGATRVVPGSHNLPYVGVPQENGGGTWMSEHAEYEDIGHQALPVPMKEGGVLLFNGTLFHGVGENMTGSPRTSITLGYRSVDELDAKPDERRQVVVAGEIIYRGNDR